MADRDILATITKRQAERPALMLAALVEAQTETGNEALGLAAALEALAGDLLATAELRLQAHMRGATSAAKDERTGAAMLKLTAVGLRKPMAKAEHAAKRDALPPAPAATSLERLDALVSDAVAEGRGTIHELVNETALAATVGEVDLAGYLRGEGAAVTVPSFMDPAPTPPAAEPPMTTTVGAPDDVPITASSRPDGWAHQAVATFTDPVGPGSREVPGPRVSWDELGEVLGSGSVKALGLPEHLSHSQVSTLADCGTKYLLQRSKLLGVVEVPQWAFIGGNAFHRAVELFEQLVAEVESAAFVKDRWNALGGSGEVWRKAFGQVVTETAIANPLVGMDMWRASKRGLENYTWWLVEGEAMVERYYATRLAELDAPWRLIRHSAGYLPAPMIEHEYAMDVGVVPFKGVIDQVWNVTADHGPMRPGDILIDDAKSGATVPGDTAQLGEYALWLQRFGGGEGKRIWGRFYDARKGTWSDPIDLLKRHPWARFAYEVAAADRKKRSGVFEPRPSSFCGGCSVKHACPIFATLPAAGGAA